MNLKITVAALAAALTVTAGAAAGSAAIPPPVYDFCSNARAAVVDGQGHAVYAGNTCDGVNQVIDYACDSYAMNNGREDYFKLTLDPGVSVTATVAHEGDAVLMVTAECIVFGTAFTCLAHADETGPGGVETISYTNDGATRTVYLVIDSHTPAGCGTYTLNLTILGEVVAERASYGAIKAAYR